jgi:hypothetical protein
MTVLILGVAILLFVLAVVAAIDAVQTRRFVDHLLDTWSTGYVHHPGGCTDPGCPCIQAYESQKQAR